MITLVAKLKARPGQEDALARECVRMARQVRENEAGCLVYAPYVSLEDSSEIVFVEKYLNREALDFHMQTPYMKELRKKLGEILGAPLEVQQFQED